MIAIGHLDLNVVEHCNFSCCACSHASPIHKPWSMPLEMMERDLRALKPFLSCGSVQILGGEPLLHPQIVEAIRLVKSIRLDRMTSVITNGSLLPRMKEEFWRELEHLQISIYPTLEPGCVTLAEAKSRAYGFPLNTTVFDAFYRQLKAEPDDGVDSFRGCHWKTQCYTVHRGHFYLCSQSAFYPRMIMHLPAETDGLPLEGITEEKLRAFMGRTEPFRACTICRAHTMETDPWREVERKRWVEKSSKLTREAGAKDV